MFTYRSMRWAPMGAGMMGQQPQRRIGRAALCHRSRPTGGVRADVNAVVRTARRFSGGRGGAAAGNAGAPTQPKPDEAPLTADRRPRS
jgi:hypothetical protein